MYFSWRRGCISTGAQDSCNLIHLEGTTSVGGGVHFKWSSRRYRLRSLRLLRLVIFAMFIIINQIWECRKFCLRMRIRCTMVKGQSRTRSRVLWHCACDMVRVQVDFPIRAHQLGRDELMDRFYDTHYTWRSCSISWWSPYPSGFVGIFLVFIRAGVSRVVSLHGLTEGEREACEIITVWQLFKVCMKAKYKEIFQMLRHPLKRVSLDVQGHGTWNCHAPFHPKPKFLII